MNGSQDSTGSGAFNPYGAEVQNSYDTTSESQAVSKGNDDDYWKDDSGLALPAILLFIFVLLGAVVFVKKRYSSQQDTMKAGYRPVPGAGVGGGRKMHSK